MGQWSRTFETVKRSNLGSDGQRPLASYDRIEHNVAFLGGVGVGAAGRISFEAQIEEVKRGLQKLIPAAELKDRSFIDIGCGSGLHALAATRLGVGRILATDIDGIASPRRERCSHSTSPPCIGKPSRSASLISTQRSTAASISSIAGAPAPHGRHVGGPQMDVPRSR